MNNPVIHDMYIYIYYLNFVDVIIKERRLSIIYD